MTGAGGWNNLLAKLITKIAVPAVLKAIHAATGKPVRTLPLRNHGMTLV